MGGKTAKRKVILGFMAGALALVALPTPSLARMEFGLGGEGRRLVFQGTLYNQSILRGNDFNWSKNLSLASSRFVPQLEFLLENLITNWGPIDKLDFRTIIRPVYEGIYDFRDGRYGKGRDRVSGNAWGHWENRIVPPIGPGRYRLAPIPGLLPDAVPDRGTGEIFSMTENQLRWERTTAFDDYPFRELYVDITAGNHWMRLGKQQVVWGKADNFRLQDLVNPIDFSIHSFLEPWQDIRIPQWMINYQYQFGQRGPFENVGLQLVLNFDDFQPIGVGSAAQPWNLPISYQGQQATALALYSKQLRNNPNLPNIFTGGLGCANPALCQDSRFKLGSIGVTRWRNPKPNVGFKDAEFGGVLEFLYQGWRFAMTYYYGFQDIPVDHIKENWSLARPDPVTGLPFAGPTELIHPKGHTVGLSMDYFEPVTSTVWRVESSYGRELWDDWNRLDLNSKMSVFKWVVGIDRPTVGGPIFQWINPGRQVFPTFQVFGQHMLNHHGGGRSGVINDRHEWIFTFGLSTNYWHDRLNPSWFIAYSPNARAVLNGGSLELLMTNHWSAKVGFHMFGGQAKEHYESNYAGFIPPSARGGAGTATDPARFNFSDQVFSGRTRDGHPIISRHDLQEISVGVGHEAFGNYVWRRNDEVFFKFGYRF